MLICEKDINGVFMQFFKNHSVDRIIFKDYINKMLI